MKKPVILFLLVVLVIATNEGRTQHMKKGYEKLHRSMPATDPNLDPNWDWTVSGPGHRVYYQTPNDGIQSQAVQLPFFTNGHPLNTTEKDIYPEDGWMLAFRDFGTSMSAPQMPFLGLYNKYRGKLRLMFYNTRELSFNNFEVTLGFKDPNHTGALLTFTDDENPFTHSYDRAKEEFMLTTANSINGWIWADFTIFGYDPNLSDLAQFRVNINGLNVSQVNLESTEFTLSQVFTSVNPGGGRSGRDLLSAANQGVKYYRSVNEQTVDLQETVTKQETAGKNPWWKDILKGAVGTVNNPTQIASFAPYVGGLVGFVSSFMSWGSSSSRAPLNFEGSLKMEGTITTSPFPLYSIDLGLASSTGSNPPDYYRSLQPIPWGVFNVKYKPAVEILLLTGKNCNNVMEFETRIVYDFNNDVGLTLDEINAAYVYQNKRPTPLYSLPYFSRHLVFPKSFNYPTEIAIQLKLSTIAPTRYADSEITIYKTIPFNRYIEIESCYDFPAARLDEQNLENLSGEFNPYPNPANEEVHFAYGLKVGSGASVEVYSSLGEKITELVPVKDTEGYERVTWDLTNSNGSRVPNGTYYYRIYHEGKVRSGALLVSD